MQTLSVIISILGLALFIASFLLKGADMKTILIFNALGNLLTHGTLIGFAVAGMLMHDIKKKKKRL